MSVTLRLATPADRPALEIIRRQAIEAAYSGSYERERFADLVARPDPDLLEWLRDDRYLALLAETPVTPVGYAVCDREGGELLALYVSPDYEDRGHASKLLERLEAELSAVATMTVWAPEPSVPFFRARGFATTGEARGGDIPRERLEKSLR